MWGKNPYTPKRSLITYFTFYREDMRDDLALLPLSLAKYALAGIWWELQKINQRRIFKQGKKIIKWLPHGNGRHTDATPIMCPYCLWAGPERWLVHGYVGVDEDDVEPVDYCPKCFTEL